METLKKVEDALWEEQQRQRDAKWLVYDDRTPRDSLRETTAIILNAEVNDSVAQRTSTSHELHRDEATSKLKKAFTMSHHSISPASPASGDEAASSASIISSLPESLKNDSASSRNATKALHDIRFKVKKLVALASDIKAKYKAEEERMRSMAPASQHQDQYRRVHASVWQVDGKEPLQSAISQVEALSDAQRQLEVDPDFASKTHQAATSFAKHSRMWTDVMDPVRSAAAAGTTADRRTGKRTPKIIRRTNATRKMTLHSVGDEKTASRSGSKPNRSATFDLRK
ncbi:hypothetical protein LTS18_003403 [Coniosporium uncinatum]|uniref:Uncharacterized protein n=1 Tax=Coniosporium uncinatum TaxID=93489 RepID=A0ACC3D6U0_9PEZI|nr:hypothetical protein LTS18_003403 [Coniosporium uncinatum]